MGLSRNKGLLIHPVNEQRTACGRRASSPPYQGAKKVPTTIIEQGPSRFPWRKPPTPSRPRWGWDPKLSDGAGGLLIQISRTGFYREENGRGQGVESLAARRPSTGVPAWWFSLPRDPRLGASPASTRSSVAHQGRGARCLARGGRERPGGTNADLAEPAEEARAG